MRQGYADEGTDYKHDHDVSFVPIFRQLALVGQVGNGLALTGLISTLLEQLAAVPETNHLQLSAGSLKICEEPAWKLLSGFD